MGHNDHIDFELLERIQDLLDEDVLEENTPAHGIALLAAHKGYDSLSQKQKYVFDTVVAPELVKRADELKANQIMNSNPD